METSEKAESRKKKVEIAKTKIACYEYLSTPSEKAFAFSRPSSKRDSYIVLLSTHQTFVKFSLAGEGVAATKSMTREWKRVEKQKVESRKKKAEIAKSRAMSICQLPPQPCL
ncbi:MAG: hypothetical protein IJA04_06760 [Bacteroidaceae bacterium]|nr:hypothetical protein [Bacteroidaceae bacterium]